MVCDRYTLGISGGAALQRLNAPRSSPLLQMAWTLLAAVLEIESGIQGKKSSAFKGRRKQIEKLKYALLKRTTDFREPHEQ